MNFKQVSKEEFGNSRYKLVRCGFDAKIVKSEDEQDDGNGSIVFAISTGDSDRMKDTIDPNGWQLENYRKNPVILWAHNKELPPIGKADSVWVEDGKLMSRAQFAAADMPHPLGLGFGHTVARMFRDGFLNAVSVGFDPDTWTFNETTGGIDFKTQELLEYSAVPIPANPHALQDASRKGYDTAPIYRWCEHALDTGDCLVLPRARVEAAHKVLSEIHGTIKGTKVEVDADEAVGIVDKIKGWLTKKEEAPAENEETMTEETAKELVEQVKALAEDVKELKAQPKVETKDNDAGIEEYLSSKEFVDLIGGIVKESVDAKMRALTGAID